MHIYLLFLFNLPAITATLYQFHRITHNHTQTKQEFCIKSNLKRDWQEKENDTQTKWFDLQLQPNQNQNMLMFSNKGLVGREDLGSEVKLNKK